MTGIQKIQDSITTAAGHGTPKVLMQTDFDDGPYTIDTPGKYKLGENIKINFYKEKCDIFDVEVTGDDFFGFPAAIKIVANGVDLDLSGNTLFQSPQDYCVQRFFALIQLNNSPFSIGHGPIPKSYTALKSAKNVKIHSGELGLTSHQCIMGNDNVNILLQDLNMCDFEVTAVTLNNVTGVGFKNVNIKRSIGISRWLPVSSYWSGLIFNYRLLKLAFIKYNICPTEQNSIINTNNEIRSYLAPILDIIYNNRTLTNIYRKVEYLVTKQYPTLCFLFNKGKCSTCGVHGFKITGPNPSITNFHESITDDVPSNRKSEDVILENCKIQKLKSNITQTINVTYDKECVVIGAGLKLSINLLNIPLICSLIYTMNLLSKNKNIKSFLKTKINDDILNFVTSGEDCSGKIGLNGSTDIMGHINKGVMALRMGSVTDISMTNITIEDIENIGETVENEKCIAEKYGLKEIDFSNTTFLEEKTYGGNYSIGAIFSGCENIDINSCNISKIKAPSGAVVGLAVNNKCKNIDIENLKVWDLTSGNKDFDSGSFVVDKDAQNINVKSMKLDPFSKTEPL